MRPLKDGDRAGCLQGRLLRPMLEWAKEEDSHIGKGPEGQGALYFYGAGQQTLHQGAAWAHPPSCYCGRLGQLRGGLFLPAQQEQPHTDPWLRVMLMGMGPRGRLMAFLQPQACMCLYPHRKLRNGNL